MPNPKNPFYKHVWGMALRACGVYPSGTTHVILGARVKEDSTWQRVEKPALTWLSDWDVNVSTVTKYSITSTLIYIETNAHFAPGERNNAFHCREHDPSNPHGPSSFLRHDFMILMDSPHMFPHGYSKHDHPGKIHLIHNRTMIGSFSIGKVFLYR